jgi:archaellum biogenesis ATPase FlaH
MNKYYFRGYSGSNVGKKIKGSYQFFDGTKIKVINAKEGKTIVINFASEVQEGELTMNILDSSNDLVAELQTNTTGIKEINSDKNQKYRLVIRGTQTKGSFNVNWEIS